MAQQVPNEPEGICARHVLESYTEPTLREEFSGHSLKNHYRVIELAAVRHHNLTVPQHDCWILMAPRPTEAVLFWVHEPWCSQALEQEAAGWTCTGFRRTSDLTVPAAILQECHALGLEVTPGHIQACRCWRE